MDANQIKVRLGHEFDSVLKNTIELKRAMLKTNKVDANRNVKQIEKNFEVIKSLYKKLKIARG